ncbi:MAG TPA: DUF4097 family beta strand repeat-containing protein [Agromyces sp.]
MRTTRTIALAGTVAVAALLTGCAWLQPVERFSDDASFDEPVQSIEIDEPDGAVHVEGVEGVGSVAVERTVSYRGQRPTRETVEVRDGVLVLGGCGRNCSVEYTVSAPAGVEVRGSTTNGAIELANVAAVDVETSNGRIELDGVTGTVDARTSNGRIEGRGLTGSGIRAVTSNGAIDLRLDAAQDVEARTSNGAIDLAVPTDGATYRVDAGTSNGSVDVGIDDTDDGEFTLDLSTSNGAIRVVGR